jgi:uncharacterized protein
MLILLSPAKNLDFSPPPFEIGRTQPRLVDEIATLAKVTAKLKQSEIAKMMHLSDALAQLNWHRFQAFDPALTGADTMQAILAFNGDVYQGLSARTLTHEDLNWAQDHVRILSGLYGLLRPFDAMAPYRLEMGTKLKTRRGNNLYQFWGSRISKAINADIAHHDVPVIVNLASTEYFGVVDKKALKARTVTCHFKEIKDGQGRVLSFYAKKARGMMARYAATRQISDVEALKGFNEEGYSFDPVASKVDNWVFTRPQPPLKSA